MMKTIILIFALISGIFLNACSDSIGPDGPRSYTEKAYNSLVMVTAKTNSDRQGIKLNLVIDNSINDYLYPLADADGYCMVITVYDREGDIAVSYYYDYQDWANLFGAYEFQPGFNYSATEYFPDWRLNDYCDWGKIEIWFQLRSKSNPTPQELTLSINYDFNYY